MVKYICKLSQKWIQAFDLAVETVAVFQLLLQLLLQLLKQLLQVRCTGTHTQMAVLKSDQCLDTRLTRFTVLVCRLGIYLVPLLSVKSLGLVSTHTKGKFACSGTHAVGLIVCVLISLSRPTSTILIYTNALSSWLLLWSP